METTNNIISISKEEACIIYGGHGNALAEKIGVGFGRFTKRLCRGILAMMRSRGGMGYR